MHRTTAARWVFAIFTFGTALLIGLFGGGLLPQKLADVLAHFAISKTQFGYLAAGVTLISIFLGGTALWAIPRFGLFRVCLAGYVLFAMGLAGLALAPSGLWALIPALLLAWGMAYLHQGNALAVQMNPDQPAATTNTLQGFNSFGKAIGAPFALLGLTWKDPFLFLAGITVLFVLLGVATRPPRPGHESGKKAEEAPAREALRRPIFWIGALGFYFMAGMDIVILFWLPMFIQGQFKSNPDVGQTTAAFAASLMLWTACLVRFCAPLLLRILSAPVLFFLCSLGVFGLLIGTEWNTWHGAWGIGGMLLCGLSLSTPRPTLYAMACEVLPQHTGLLALVMGGAHSLAFLTFLPLTGWLADARGIGAALRVAPGLTVLGMLACIPLIVARRGGGGQRSKSLQPAGEETLLGPVKDGAA
jgi:fucose permease